MSVIDLEGSSVFLRAARPSGVVLQVSWGTFLAFDRSHKGLGGGYIDQDLEYLRGSSDANLGKVYEIVGEVPLLKLSCVSSLPV